jgi:hypothetical protein
MIRAADFDLRDRTPFQAGKQDASQAVSNCRAEPSLKRFGREFAVSRRNRGPIIFNYAWQLQTTPFDMHFSTPITKLINLVCCPNSHVQAPTPFEQSANEPTVT